MANGRRADMRNLIIDWASYGLNLAGTAGNGREALQLAEEQKPDIVLSDIRMPHIDGLELAEQLIAKYSDVKIILNYYKINFNKIHFINNS
jgi:two-component system response regulator YesN